IVLQNATSVPSVVLLLQSGTGTFPTQQAMGLYGVTSPFGAANYTVLLDDFNGDLLPDLAVYASTPNGNVLAVQLNQGAPNFFSYNTLDPTPFILPSLYLPAGGEMVGADLDGNGLQDIVTDSGGVGGLYTNGFGLAVLTNNTSVSGLGIPVTIVPGQTLANNNFVAYQF